MRRTDVVGGSGIGSVTRHSLLAGNETMRAATVLDGDTLEVLHPERIRLPNEWRNRKNGKAHILACYFDSYGVNKIRAASPTKMATKRAGIMTTSMITSWVDRGFDSGIDTTRTWSGKLGKPLVLERDITSATHALVKDGWCWWYRKYAPDDTVLEGLEKEAREGRKGLWADPDHIPPWVYRKARRGQALDLSDVEPLGTRKNRGSYAKPDNP
jgi:hypothetical protein